MIERSGLNQNCITNTPSDYGSPVWSPDGNFLAVNAKQNNGYGFNIFKVVDGSSIQLSAQGVDPRGNPVWSPEGTRLVFQAQAEGNLDLFVALVSTNEFIRVTTIGGYDGEPAWSVQ
jgi:TolB protein